MKLLFIAPRFHTNQVEIVRALQERGHEVRFLATLKGPTEDHSLLVPQVLPESPLSRALRKWFGDGDVNLSRYFPRAGDCFRVFREFAPDLAVIRIHGFFFSHLAAACARLVGCRVIFYQQVDAATLARVHATGLSGRLRRAGFHARLLAFSAAWMTPVPVGPGDPGRLPRRCHFVPFAVPVVGEVRRPGRSLRFLVVGKYQPRKQHLLMLEAASRLSERYDFRITFVGEVATPEHAALRARVEAAAQGPGLAGRVDFRDNVPFARMPELYRSHDVFVLPSSDEPASVSILEALGQAMPVICSDTCGTRTYLREGGNGFIFASANAASLASALERFLADPGTCASMSIEALRMARERLSADAFYRSFMAMAAGRFRPRKEDGPDIAFVLDCGLGGGGAERVAVRLIASWTDSGKKVTMITMSGPEGDLYPAPPGIRRIVVGPERPPRGKPAVAARNLGDIFRLRRILKELDAPLIISFLTIPNIRTVLAAFSLGKRVIISERIDTTRERQAWFWLLLRRLVYRFASVVTANSQVALDNMSRYVPARKLAYVPNPVPLPVHPAAPQDSRLILNVGRLAAQKNQALLVEAMAILGARGQGWSADILGQGPDEAMLASLIREKGLAGVVRLRGVVADPEPYYRSAGIFALTSLYEGTPNALLEAMAHGLPCLVPDGLPGALSHVQDGVTGLVFRSGDPRSLADKLALLIENPALRKRLGDSARQRMLPFAPDKVAAIWDRLGVSLCAA